MKTEPSAAVGSVDLSCLPEPVLSEHAQWVELYDFAWRLAARNIRRSRGRLHMDAAWDPQLNYQWVWDTCFMALYCRYAADRFPGVQSLDNFYELQREDGYISMTYAMDTGDEPYPDRINPPLFAWVEWEHYRTTGDASRLERVVPHIERLAGWIDAHRRNVPHRRRGGGDDDTYSLYYFADCGSSGMDDSPRTPRLPGAGQYFDWIDLSSQMALCFRLLGELHGALGNAPRAAHWRARAAELGALINRELWCERTRFYHDRAIPTNFVSCKTAAGFWPVLAGICPADRLDALVAHLRDPNEFARPMPVPTLSADDPNYSPEGVYWLGGVWAPTNYMIARGLMLAGRGDTAHGLACAYIEGLNRTRAEVEPHTLWESYAPERFEPGLRPYDRGRVKPDFVGWTGIGPIAMLIENVLGIDADAVAGRIEWTLRLTEEHGIRALPVGAGSKADLLCRARRAASDPATVTVCAERDLRVRLVRGPAALDLELGAGQTRTVEV